MINLKRFLLLSILVHIFTIFFTGRVETFSNKQSSPITVSIYEENEEDKNLNIPKGKIIDLPMLIKEEKPDKADLLAMVNSKAKADNSPSIEEKKVAIPLAKMKQPKSYSNVADEVKKTQKVYDKKDKGEEKRTALLEKDPNRFSEALRREVADKEKMIKAIEEKIAKREKQIALKTKSLQEIKEPVRKEFRKNMEGRDIDEFVKNNPKGYLERGDEAIISLNTKKFKFAKYFSSIKNNIEDIWEYPDEAILNGLKGVVLLRFTLLRNGEVEEVKVVKSSNETVLDNNSVNVVWNAGPFRPFPQNFKKSKIHIIVNFSYRPTYDSVNLHR